MFIETKSDRAILETFADNGMFNISIDKQFMCDVETKTYVRSENSIKNLFVKKHIGDAIDKFVDESLIEEEKKPNKTSISKSHFYNMKYWRLSDYKNLISKVLFKTRVRNILNDYYKNLYVTDDVLNDLKITKDMYLGYIKNLTLNGALNKQVIFNSIRQTETNVIITPPKNAEHLINSNANNLNSLFHYPSNLVTYDIYSHASTNDESNYNLSNLIPIKSAKLRNACIYFRSNTPQNNYCSQHKIETKNNACILIFENLLNLQCLSEQLLENNGMNTRTSMSRTLDASKRPIRTSFISDKFNLATTAGSNAPYVPRINNISRTITYTRYPSTISYDKNGEYENIFLNLFVTSQTVPLYEHHFLNLNKNTYVKEKSKDISIYASINNLKDILLEYSKIANMVHYRGGLFQTLVVIHKLFASDKFKL